jgi:hypothetical protein
MAEQHLPHAERTHAAPAPHDNVLVQHEESDVNVRAVISFVVGLIVFGVVMHVAVWGFYRFLDARQDAAQVPSAYPLAAEQEHRLPPEPRLQINPREDLRELREQENATLSTYGWVDKNAGVVRIPIAEAMKLTIQRGLPARAAGATR